MGADILSISVGETWRRVGMVAKASGGPIVVGTVSYYLKALTGDNAGKWWHDESEEWAETETANAMTHQADGNWTIELAASPFEDGVIYLEYAKESGNLHIAAEGRLLRGDGGGTFTEADRTKLTNCNTQATRFAGMIGLDGAVYRYTANTLELAPTGSSVIVSLSTVTLGTAPIVNLTAYQYAAFGAYSITAESGQEGDLVLVAYKPGESVVDWQLTSEDGEITAGGTGNRTVTIDADETVTTEAGVWRYVLRNTTDKTVICTGTITIEAVPDVEEEPVA